MDERLEKSKLIYEYLYGVCSGVVYGNFWFMPNEEKMFDNFVKKLNYSIGDDWLWNFFCFQFNHYVDMKTFNGRGKVMVGWVIGDKALQRFRNATEQEMYFTEVFRNRFKVKNPLKVVETLTPDKEYLERERNRFKDSVRQLIHCKEHNLYDSKSKTCFMCINKNDCKPIK